MHRVLVVLLLFGMSLCSTNVLFSPNSLHPFQKYPFSQTNSSSSIFFLELGKLLYARVSKFDFLGDTCARLIVGCDVKGKAIWTNFNRRRKYMWALLFSEFLGKSEHAKEKNNNVA